jgi:hypothetical protein
MGLDVYVGTLTRYYSGEWQTVVQQAAAATGVPVEVVRMNESPDAVRDAAVLEGAAIAWRDGLNAGLQPHLSAPLAWSEGMTAPYFTDKPAWDSYSALLTWAAHEEHPDLQRPGVALDDWSTDAAVERSRAKDFASRYGHLLYGPELWLPGEFTFTFEASDLGGNVVSIGSVHTLLAQLHDLNARTWRLGAVDVSRWRREGAEPGAPLETSARFGFSVFLELAQAAVEHNLPMKLDY